jgi:hypothetical protein
VAAATQMDTTSNEARLSSGNWRVRWEAVESGNPHSVDYGNREIRSSPDWMTEWEALEAENPHNAQPVNRAKLEVTPQPPRRSSDPGNPGSRAAMNPDAKR